MKALTHLFDPPEGFVGEFGWLCGLTADPLVLDDAMERFTGMTAASRALDGAISLVAILDPGAAQISAIDVPGLWHAPYIATGTRPFRLMHAKVALLGFRHRLDDRFHVRVVVSTGNWTRDTLERSIDLAWFADVQSVELTDDADADVSQRTSDISAANRLFVSLREWFDCTIVEQPIVRNDSVTLLRQERMREWLQRIDLRSSGPARFFDNRRDSLLSQLCTQVAGTAGSSARNRLMMGSGFFEIESQTFEGGACLKSIVKALRDDGLITQKVAVDVYVNRETCHGLRGLLGQPGWSIREGRWSHEPDRTLHAKFIFSGFQQARTDSCGSAWLYLGSGNLTGPGFLNRSSNSGGNLEAGVTIKASDLEWDGLGEHLPVGSTDLLTEFLGLTATSDEIDVAEPKFTAAPVTALVVDLLAGGPRLSPVPAVDKPQFEVVDGNGQRCSFESGAFVWNGKVPRMVRVRWNVGTQAHESFVPCIDAYGRIAGADLQELSIDEAWDELTSFPDQPDGGAETDAVGMLSRGFASPERRAPSYVVRRMMDLIERIAARQCDLAESEWTHWCLRIEQTLNRAAGCETVASTRELGFNVLSPLLQRPFLPDFVEDGSPRWRQYEAALASVANAWRMESMQPLGVVP